MWRRIGILIACQIVAVVAVWIAVPGAPERIPDLSGATPAAEVCSPLSASPTDPNQFFARFITALKEPRLDCGRVDADETYRITWASVFLSYDPLTVTVHEIGGRVDVTASEHRYRSEERVFSTVVQTKHQVVTAEWVKVRTRLANIDFWQMERDETFSAQDGSSWTIEGRVGRSYQRVTRRSPGLTSFRRVALELLQLGEFGDPEPVAVRGY